MNEQVIAGADLLDRVWPGWWTLIDKSTLDLSSERSCILGQLGEWANEHEAPVELPEPSENDYMPTTYNRMVTVLYEEEAGFAESRYGFDRRCSIYPTYEDLDEEWQEVILQRELAASTDTVSPTTKGQPCLLVPSR